MTRGKYAARASNTHAAADAAATTAAYQRKIAELTEQRDALTAESTAERARNARAERVLRTQRDEGLSPEVAARDRVIADLRADLAQQKKDFAAVADRHATLYRHLRDQLMSAGRTEAEATEDILEILGYSDLTYGLGVHKGRLNSEAAEAVQRARGERRAKRGQTDMQGLVDDAKQRAGAERAQEELTKLTLATRKAQATIAHAFDPPIDYGITA